ncbi:hypothetical protein ACJMK2_024565 [Sinanodonta woodiana]|uniref:LDLR chaperone MESD n=1 Tax=Sinanodonta woodiana TaxID=1069815 RepID=A0ABD3XFR5_SINWO
MASQRNRTAMLIVFACFIVYPALSAKEKKKDGDSPADKWKKKDVRDYTEADAERLFEQWEDTDDEKLEEDELPEWKREPPKIDLSQLDPSNPEAMIKMSKKGRTLMMFASVSGKPTQTETEKITQLWQSSLFNANIETERYVVSEDRVIFMVKDGSFAWDVKDYLVKQERCLEVTIEGKNYPGLGDKTQAKDTDTQEKKQSKPISKKDNEVKKDKKSNDNKKKDKKLEDNKTTAKSKDEL